MRKKINLTGFIITGAAALFVGLAGNMHAIPISMHNNWEAGMRSWVLGRDLHGNEWVLGQTLHGNEIAHLVDQSSRNQSLASPTAFFLFRSVPAHNAGEPVNFGPWNFNHHRHGVTTASPPLTGPDPVTTASPPLPGPDPVTTTSPPLTGQEPNDPPTSVPDGGTTAMMMAGAFCGLALLRKTLKV